MPYPKDQLKYAVAAEKNEIVQRSISHMEIQDKVERYQWGTGPRPTPEELNQWVEGAKTEFKVRVIKFGFGDR
jgi:hypothetical protein